MTNTVEKITITFNRQGDDAADGKWYESVANLYAKKMESRFPDAIVDVVGKSSGFEVFFDNDEQDDYNDDYANFVTRAMETAIPDERY